MPTRILVVRHGETQWNKENRLQGQLDTSLTPLGKQQVHAVGKRLQDEEIDLILTSPLGRTLETTEIITQYNPTIPVQRVEVLMERSFGMFEGMTFAEIEEQFPHFAYNDTIDKYLWLPPNGENYELLQSRIHPYLERLVADHKGKSVLLVCHGGVVRAALSYFNQLKREDWFSLWVQNTSLSIITIEENGKIACPVFNDVHHLEMIGAPEENLSL